MSSQSLAYQLAEFIVNLEFDQLPGDVQEKARVCLMNGYGIALGCHNTDFAPVARKAAVAMEGERSDGATLLGDGRKTSIAGAVLANCALFHGRAQEDTCGAAHLGTIMIPLLTALAESKQLPVERLLPALVVGYEIGGLLDGNFGGMTTPSGFRASPLYGTIAAAAAASKMMALSVEETAAALANSVSFTGGVLQSFADGTDEWRYQVGVASRLAYVSAELAAAGSVSAPNAFEGAAGLIKVYAKSETDVPGLMAQLGQQWSIHRVTFKPYPVCAFNQTPVNAMLALNEKLNDQTVNAVRVYMNPFECGYAGMDSQGPFNSISGTLMSIPFCIANTMIHGVPDMGMMTTYDDAQVEQMIAKIDLLATDEVPILSCRIEVDLASGKTVEHYQQMTTDDYSFDRDGVRDLICRVGAESGIQASTYKRVEDFVYGLPQGNISDVLTAFAELPKANV